MTDQEKSEVLLEFAGFYPKVFTASSDEPTETLWSDPLDREWLIPKPPDLLHSLDAQAKWLYPKIYEVKLHQRSNIMNGQWCAEVFLRTPMGCIYRDTPAEALVDALLYVIKEEMSNE